MTPSSGAASFVSTSVSKTTILDLPPIRQPLFQDIQTPNGPTQVMTAAWQRWFQQVQIAVNHLHYTDAVFDETPSGVVDGANLVFGLANPPVFPNSLQLFMNGALLNFGVDYTLAGQTITFVVAPPANAVLLAYYRK